MTNAERRAAQAEVESARAALVTHLNQLEDAVNVPKRAARSVGRGVRAAQRWATDHPAAAAGAATVAVSAIAGVIALVARLSRR